MFLPIILLQSQESGILSSTPGPRRHSVESHDSPINPGSPILDDDSSGDQYKNCPYRSTIGSMGISAAFNSFPSPHHHQSTSLPPLATGMGYPSQSSMCHASMYATQDSTMCPSSVPQPLGMPAVWRCVNSKYSVRHHLFSSLNVHNTPTLV